MNAAEWQASTSPHNMMDWLTISPTSNPVRAPLITPDQLRHWVRACQHFADPTHGNWNPMETEYHLQTAVDYWCQIREWLDTCPLALRADLLREVVGNPFRPETLRWEMRREGLSLVEVCRGRGWEETQGVSWLTPQVFTLAAAAALPGQVCQRCGGIGKTTWHPTKVDNHSPLFRTETCPDCRGSGRVGVLLDQKPFLVLADALLDSGCEEESILGHLRSPGPHVRGCWALDCITARE